MLLKILLGLLSLFLGRRLFWVFVGVVGFGMGVRVATQLFAGAPQLTVLLIALAAGVVGAMLAYFVQELVIAVVGFLAGGQIGVMVAAAALHHPDYVFGVPFIIGGIVGAVLFLVVFDWALIWISSLLGAGLIVEGVNLAATAAAVAYVVLVAVGVVVQASWWRGLRTR
jgi:Domain of unknown function (DUF4203)